MTESPIAVTSSPGIGWLEESAALAAAPDAAWLACALVAAPTRSPFRICLCMPAGAGVAWKTLHPAVNVAVSTAAAPSAGRTRARKDRERFSANSSAIFPLMAFFLTELE
jgi:hypothetical protein